MRATKKSLQEFCAKYRKADGLFVLDPAIAKISIEGREILYKESLQKISPKLKGNRRKTARRRLRIKYGLRKPQLTFGQVVARKFIADLEKTFDL